MSGSKVELTRPKGEDWNDMFKGVSVKDRLARLQGNAQPQKATIEKITPPPPSAPQRADADTYTGQKPFSYTSPSSAPAHSAPTHSAPAHTTYSAPAPQRAAPVPAPSYSASATISRPSASGGDEIDALIAGMNFDSDAPDPSGVYCGRCHKALSRGANMMKYGGKTYHPNCWSCSKCRTELGSTEFWFEGKDTLCGKCYKAYARPHCASCNEAIMEAECTIANGQKYHAHHFKCDRCQTKLQDDFFSKDNRVFCPRDYAELYNPKCIKCSQATREKFIQVGEGCYHPNCFTCTKCHREIGEGQFCEVNGQIRCSNTDCRK